MTSCAGRAEDGRGAIAGLFEDTWPTNDASHLLAILEKEVGFASPEIAVAFLAIECPDGLPHVVFEAYSGSAFSAAHRVVVSNLAVHHIKKRVGASGEAPRQVAGYLATLRCRDVWFLVTSRRDMQNAESFSDYLSHGMLSWVDVFYPAISRISLRSSQLVGFLQGIDERCGGAMRLVRTTMRYPEYGHQRTERLEDLPAVRERLEDERGYLDRATYLVPGSSGYEATVGRDGLFYYHRGALRSFLDDAVALVDGGRADRERVAAVLASDRRTHLPVINVEFEGSVGIESLESAESLVGAIETSPSFSVTVLHGNPYLHLTVMDRASGSAFVVYSTSGSSLRIYPGVNADLTATQHLLDCIAQRFAEVRSVDTASFPV